MSVLATSTRPDDDALAERTLEGRVDVVRGPADDVLERFLSAVDRHGAELVIRVTGDCPLVSFELADLLVEEHLAAGADVTFAERDYPPGIGCEVYDAAALRRLRQVFPQTPYSEYLILYFKHNPEVFRLNEVPAPQRFRADWRLTLDEPSDLALLELLCSTLGVGREPVPWESVRRFFDEHPEAAAINADNQLRYADDPILRETLREATTVAR